MLIKWYERYKQNRLSKNIKKLEWALSILQPKHAEICGLKCYWAEKNFYQVGNYITKEFEGNLFIGGRIDEEVDYVKLINSIHKEAVFKLRNEKYKNNGIRKIKWKC